MRSFKYRLYANQKTMAKAEQWLYLCRYLYNCALEQRMSFWKYFKKTVTYNQQQKELTLLKAEYAEYLEMPSEILTDVLWKLDKAYKIFFKRNKAPVGKRFGVPRFKGEHRYNSFTLHRYNWKLDGKYLTINKLGRFKLKLSRMPQGRIKAITIKRTNTNKWYAFIICDINPVRNVSENQSSIGIDVGINSYLTDSNGNKISNPKFLSSIQHTILLNKHRKLSRTSPNSNRHTKARIALAKQYEDITNQRNDFLHKLSTLYVSKYNTIIIEDLDIVKMMKFHRIANSISDCAWGRFFSMLSYKAEEAGGKVIKVNPRYTSRKCNYCGAIYHNLKMQQTSWICESCGTTHDRDKNAARNIAEAWAEPSDANVKQEFVRSLNTVSNTDVKTTFWETPRNTQQVV